MTDEDINDVIIIGGGVAGLTAAIYTARAMLKPIVIGGSRAGGQIVLTTHIENYPGFEEGVKGFELYNKIKKQAERFGARILQINAASFEKNEKEGYFEIGLSDNTVLKAKTAIIATGSNARRLGLESENKYWSRGVSTCATCDGFFFKDKNVAVVGGGDSACEEAIFLSKLASKVTVIHRRDAFRASKIMQQKVFDNPKIDVVWDSTVEDVVGDGQKVIGLKIKNVKTNNITDFKCDAIFLAIGHIPNTKIFDGKLKLDKQGYVKIDKAHMTSIEGVFAAGDVHDNTYRQIATATGSGCRAAIELEKYIECKKAEKF